MNFNKLQILALYDSSSRLVRGDPTKPKPVVDYIVFERNLTLDESSSWRIAGKLPPQQPWRKGEEGDKQDGHKQLAAT